MGIFKKKEDYLGLKQEVTTTEEFDKAAASGTGVIVIKGDLYKDIKKSFEKEKRNIGGKALFGGGLGVALIAPFLGPLCLLGVAAMLLSSLPKEIAKKARKYKLRITPNYGKTDELTLTHEDLIERERAYLKDKDMIHVDTNLDLLEDAMAMKVNTIIVNKVYTDQVCSDLITNDDWSKDANKLKDVLSSNGIYKGYRIVAESDKYKFIRIR